mmetsp:Transcript_8884/g.14793  ORF Transcript_8884/g.14793 Transcript_8884/m.14793 type:complete len:317 (+) Transcript_8884:6-956(+)
MHVLRRSYLFFYTNTTMNLALLPFFVLLSVASIHAFVVVPSTSTKVAQCSAGSSTALNGILGRFRRKEELQIGKPIALGGPIPAIDVEMLTTSAENDEIVAITIPIEASEVLGGEGKSVLVGMPGAFTPTCSKEHLPGFIDASSQLRKLGVNTIAVVTTNDKFVNEEWAKNAGLLGGREQAITVLADGDAELVKTLGLAEDMGFGVGVRSKRFVLVCENGVVTNLLMDEGMDSCELTSAENLIKVLTPSGQEVAEEMDQKTMALMGGGVALVLVAMFFMSGGDDHTATVVAPAMKVIAPAVKAGSKDFTLLKQFGS